MAKNNDTVDTVVTGNTRRRSRNWAFTVNNPKNGIDTKIIKFVEKYNGLYVIGHEVGKKGTPHLQGYCSFENAISFNSLKSLMPTAHIEKAHANAATNYGYCTKDGNFKTNIVLAEIISLREKLLNQYENVVWKPWQKRIIKILKKDPDSRSIYWVHDSVGNSGKSFLCKYLFLKYNCIIADGKKDNVFNQLNIWMSNHKDESPHMILLDCPRHSFDYINYGMLEMLKNGLVYSGKYEGGVCCFEHPHVVVFANSMPDLKKWSVDRLHLIDLDDGLEARDSPSRATDSQDSVSESSEECSCELGVPSLAELLG